MYSVAQLRPGQAIVLEGDPFIIMSTQFGRKSQSKANNVTKLKNLKTGAVISKTFMGNDQIQPADVGYRHIQFLYVNDDMYSFMDLNDYNQFDLSGDVVGDGGKFLVEGVELDALIYDNRPIGVRIPVTVDLKVIETMPGVKGDTASGGGKPAKLQSGITVQVPLFVCEGETVRINTEREEYVERV